MVESALSGFTAEQQDYLESLLKSLDLSVALDSASSQASSSVESVHGVPVEDLCKEERLKFDCHPFELLPKLRRHSLESKLPDGGDVFMFKFYGLFNVSPAQQALMCRMRLAGGLLTADQLQAVGQLSKELAGGYAHVTTRSNLQLREIQAANILPLLNGLQAAALTSKGAGADSVRNITCTPTSGFDPQELIDLRPYASQLHYEILNTPSLHGIPRKFNIVFDCGGSISCVSGTNDLTFAAEKSPDGQVLCRILLGGITGHLDFARDTGWLCSPEQTIDVSVAVLNVFVETGDRTNRKKARLKYVLDNLGFDKFMALVQEKLDFSLTKAETAWTQSIDRQKQVIQRKAHIGVHPQKEADLRYLGIALTAGKMTSEQMIGLADIARQYGRGDLRLTVWQNILIPYIHESKVQEVSDKIRSLGLDIDASSFAAGLVACTGKTGCKFASSHTKEHGADLIKYLQTNFQLEEPINIHLTGCSHSCAQHYVSDIGLLGASTADGEEAYQVYLGGGCDGDEGLGEFLEGPVAVSKLNEFIGNIVGSYLKTRNEKETFLDFVRRHNMDELKNIFAANKEAQA